MTREEILNKYKIDKNLRNANLSYADLHNADLRYFNLHYADLRNANLSYADLHNADLRYSNLHNADLSNADLSYSNLRNANLSYADLSNADLRYADLHNADLSYAKNINSIYIKSDLDILRYQVGKIKAFKYLHGNKSPYQNYVYEIGKTYTFNKYDTDEFKLCSFGGNVATLKWCLIDARFDLTKTYIIVEFTAKDIVAIPYNSDGKFRVKKFKIVRKVTKKELEKELEILNPTVTEEKKENNTKNLDIGK